MRFIILFLLITFLGFLFPNPYDGILPVIGSDPVSVINSYFDVNISTLTGNAVCNQSSSSGDGTYYVFQGKKSLQKKMLLLK